jgi:hypothetical protein
MIYLKKKGKTQKVMIEIKQSIVIVNMKAFFGWTDGGIGKFSVPSF